MDVRVCAQGSRETVDVGIGSVPQRFNVAMGGHFRYHLVPQMVPAERGEAAEFVGIGVRIIGDVVFQVNKDHHDAM